MEAKIKRLYQQFRKASPFMLVGESAKLALSSAKTLARFQELESLGLVRLRVEAEEESYLDIFGKPEAYTNAQGHLVSAETALVDLVRTLDLYGVWYSVSEYLDENGEWQHADSCGMHTGYKDPSSPFENCYIIGQMAEAVEKAEGLIEEREIEKAEREARKAKRAKRIRRHFFFTFASRKTDRTYGGENYTLNVFENKGRGEIVHLGTASNNSRGHMGFESEAWAQVIFPSLTKYWKKVAAIGCKSAFASQYHEGLEKSYYTWSMRDTCGIRLDQFS